MKHTSWKWLFALGLVAVLAACGSSKNSSTHASKGTPLAGTLTIKAGACTGPEPSGSYFRMVQPGGNPAAGPFVSNADSTCRDKTYTALAPGTDHGITLGKYQPQPAKPFGPDGSSASTGIVTPAAFFAVRFGVSTNPIDPQTHKSTKVPTISREGNRLTGDLSALAVSWNGQFFNQGSPKPGGGASSVHGTFDAATGAYTLEWVSTVAGGPFNGFAGFWHLEGTVEAK